jgi:ATP/maltotriose-dependent transcriptional regulator MalT
VRRLHEILELAADEQRLDAWTRSMLAVLEAMRGRSEEARSLYRASQRGLAQLGLILPLAGARMYAGIAELVLDDAAAAEREFRHGCDVLEEIGEQATLSTMLALLALALTAQERFDDAEPLAQASKRAAAADDLASQVLWRGAIARVLAHRGELERAGQVADEAVRLSRSTDFINMRADLLVDLSNIRRLAGREDAEAAAAEARALYDAKGNIASASRTRDTLRRPTATGRTDG